MSLRTANRFVLITGYVSFAAVCVVALVWWLLRESVIASSISPDGKFRCVITDADPNPYQVTLIYKIERVGSSIPISGTNYILYRDSVAPGAVSFDWSPGRVIVRHDEIELRAELRNDRQFWGGVPYEPPPPKPPRIVAGPN